MSEENNNNAKQQDEETSGRREHIVLEALIYQQSGMRRGTAKVKSRGEVSGGGAKPWRQKGTGRARQGSIRAVQWKGGGRAFGSAQRNYKKKMNKKARSAALKALIGSKQDEGRIVVQNFSFEAPSTKQFVSFLAEKEMTGKVLFLYSGATDRNVIKSARNVPEVTLLHFDKLNVKDLLNNEWLLVAGADAERLPLESAGPRGE